MRNPDSTIPRRRVGVVIPARNEARQIGPVLDGLDRVVDGVPVHPIVVDDGSSDATAQVARARGATVISHPVNLGKGAALKTGCLAAIRAGIDVLVLMDADGQHRPSDLRTVLRPIVDGEAELVLARRRLSREMPALMRLGNWGLSQIFAVMFGQVFSDTQCGFRAFTVEAYNNLEWVAEDYSVETEMLVHAARTHVRTVEVAIDTIYHDAYKGTTVGDGMRVLVHMIRLRIGA